MDNNKTLQTLFEERVRLNPRHTAAIMGNDSLSYAELNKRCNQLAYYLISKGLHYNKPIAFCLDRSFDVLISMMAVIKAGGAYLPLDSAHPQERLHYILQDSKAEILITHSGFKHLFSNYSGTIIYLDKDYKKFHQFAKTNPNTTVTPDHLAYIIYTSGSTGAPKGVLIEHQSLVNYCHWLQNYCGLKVQDRIDFSSNHIFDMAVTTTVAALALGLCVVLCSDEIKMNTRLYFKYLRAKKINIIKLTPSYFKVLVQELKSKHISLPALRSIIMGGEAISTPDCKSWLALYPNQVIYNEYGPTEATVGTTVFAVRSANVFHLDANVPIGKPGLNMHCVILDANMQPVAPGEIGELYIGGACLARGYLNQDALTEKYFITLDQQRLYKTGDLCRISDNGNLEYAGRIDDQVKIRGFRIEPAEVEKCLAGHPAIQAAVVVAQKDLFNENQLIGYYLLKPGHENLSGKQIREFMQKLVPNYMIPTSFINIHSIPLTANGKLDKAALPEPQSKTSQDYKEPRSTTEKTLVQIWSKELGVQMVGIDDDFFELGGHSLSAGRVISMINSVFGRNIHLHDLYNATTIAKLAPIVEKAKKTRLARIKVSRQWLKKIDDIPLSDFQFLVWMAHTYESKVKKLNISLRKRLRGQINHEALIYALKQTLKEQEVLNYHVFKFRPAQMLVKKRELPLKIEDLQHLSVPESEQILEQSIQLLNAYNNWKKNNPLLQLCLFYLPNAECELQLCMPHIVSDDFSPDIVLNSLSKHYEQFQQNQMEIEVKATHVFREYVYKEQFYFKTDLDADINFWDQYLRDTAMIEFPSSLIIKDMRERNMPYSSFVTIDDALINQLKKFCAQQHISIVDGLTASLGKALINCGNNFKADLPYILMNIVKSTRDSSIYDEAIGCFLRVEPVKINLQQDMDFMQLARQIHQSAMDTSMHQRCPGIIKLASTHTLRKRSNRILSIIIKSFASLYALIVKAPQIYRKIFNLGGVRFTQYKPRNFFMININVQHGFLSSKTQNNANLFGVNALPISQDSQDLLSIDNVLDVCFLRKEEENQPYLVLSGNLNPEYRKMLAKEMIRIMSATADAHPLAESYLATAEDTSSNS